MSYYSEEIEQLITAWAKANADRARSEKITLAAILEACGIENAKGAQIIAARTLAALRWARSESQHTINGKRAQHAWAPDEGAPAAPAAKTAPAVVPALERARVTASHDRRERRGAEQRLRHAYDRISSLEHLIERYTEIAASPVRRVKPARLHEGKRNATAVALLSDIHAEEEVRRTAAIPNEYNLAIADRRVARFFAGVTWLVQRAQRDFDIDALVLWLGGDLITGHLHEENLERTACPPAEATLIVRDWIHAGIRVLLDALPGMRLVIPCSIGNHGRTTKRMRAATGYGHSWEWLIYNVLAHDFRDEPRVTVHTSEDVIQYVDVYDYTLAFHHGFAMRYNGGVGGITIPATKQVLRWQQWRAADYYHFGHFHTQLDLGTYAFNGSVIGPNAYALSIGASPDPPRQSFYLLDEKRGKTHVCPVWVGESAGSKVGA